MPQIPEFTQRANVISANPIGADISPSAYGSVGESIAQVGKEFSQFGYELAVKRKEAQDQDYAHTKANQLIIDLEDQKIKAQAESGPDASGYSDRIRQFLQDRYQQDQQNAPSETARQIYARAAGSDVAHAVAQAGVFENTKRAQYYTDNVKDQLDARASTLLTNPTATNALNARAFSYDYIEGMRGTIGDTGATASRNYADKIIGDSYLAGLLNTKQYEAGLAAIAYRSKNAVNPEKASLDPLHGMTAERLAEEQGKFLSRREADLKSNYSEFRALSEDQKAFSLATGRPVDPGLYQQIHAYQKAGVLTANEAASQTYDLKISEAAGQALQQARVTPNASLQGVSAQVPAMAARIKADLLRSMPNASYLKTDEFGAKVQILLADKVQRAIDDISKQRSDDPAQAALEAFPNDLSTLQTLTLDGNPAATAQYTKKVLAKQDAMGIPPSFQRVTTKAMSSTDSQMVLGAQTSGQASQVLGFLQTKYGAQAPKALAEMAQDHKELAPFLVATYFQDPIIRARAVDNAKNSEEILKAFENENPRESAFLTNEVKNSIQDLTSAISVSDSGGDSIKLANAFENLVKVDAIKRMKTQGLERSEAVDASAAQLKQNYIAVKAGRSQVVVPVVLSGGDPGARAIESFMDQSLSDGGMAKLAPGVPQGTTAQEFYPRLAKISRWVTNSAQTGMRLVYDDPRGFTAPVPREDRKPIEVLYQDIIKGRVGR
jgi:hypothetical protein